MCETFGTVAFTSQQSPKDFPNLSAPFIFVNRECFSNVSNVKRCADFQALELRCGACTLCLLHERFLHLILKYVNSTDLPPASCLSCSTSKLIYDRPYELKTNIVSKLVPAPSGFGFEYRRPECLNERIPE